MSTTETLESKPQEIPPPRPAPQQPSKGSKVVRRIVILGLVIGLPILFLFMLVGSLASRLMTPPEALVEKTFNKRLWNGTEGKIAIIRLEGTILSGEGFIKHQIEQVIKDKSVKGVVLRINSPGGLVAASDLIYHQLSQMRDERGEEGTQLPMVVSMGGLAASGGYYAAMAVGDTPDSVYAEPSTWTGSIGVIIPHYNFAGFLKDHGIEEDSIRSHPLKGMGSLARKLKPEEEKILQGLVDSFFTKFKDIVQSGRPKMSREQIDSVATGQVFTMEQALANGLVDKEGYLEDAIRGVIGMAGLSESQVRVVEYQKQPTLIDLFLAEAKQQPSLDVSTLLNATTPQAHYLYTWLPGVMVGNER
jgi:protease-4